MVKARIDLYNAQSLIKLGDFEVELTKKELQELRQGYKDCKEDEELLADRLYCDKVTDAGEALAEKLGVDYGCFDYGHTHLTFEDGHEETIENPWWD